MIMYFIGKTVYVLLVYVPAFPKTGVMFHSSLRYFPFVPLFPKTSGRPSNMIYCLNKRLCVVCNYSIITKVYIKKFIYAKI